MSWAVHHATGAAATFHARPLDTDVERAVHVWYVEAPALVLGSTQPDAVADAAACRAAGVSMVRRRSGGGAVLLDPGEAVWVDVEVPRRDPLWDDDVGRAAWWVGECWAAALGALGVADARVHRGGLVTTPWSRLVCFAGLGPGEVTAGGVGSTDAGAEDAGAEDAGAKVVGVAQRRTRSGARFQCAVALRWRPGRLAGLLDLPVQRRNELAADLADRVLPVVASPQQVADSFVRHLP